MKKIMRWFITSQVVVSFIFLAGCGGSGSSRTIAALEGLASCTAQAGSAVICGTVYAADGTTPVANATISEVTSGASLVKPLGGLRYKNNNGELTADSSACTTDDVGQFACLADCSGSTTFQISDDTLFSTELEFTATCTAGEVTNVSAASTTATSEQSGAVQWLVIPGSFDGIQLLLSQLKGCTLTGDESSPESLSSSQECEDAGLTVLDSSEVATFLAEEDLSVFAAIFVNCSADYSDAGDVTNAIQTYVNDGGNLYFSDLADSWLTSDFPGLITYPGDKNATSSGTISGATVVDSGLETFLGSSTMDIIFDLGVWTAMDSVVAGWTTYIEADISALAPTMPGTTPITVGGPSGDGCIFYTSYHVEGAQAGSDQEEALKYLVLNRVNNCS